MIWVRKPSAIAYSWMIQNMSVINSTDRRLFTRSCQLEKNSRHVLFELVFYFFSKKNKQLLS